MPLVKLAVTTITPAVPAVEAHAATLVCTPAPPVVDTGGYTGYTPPAALIYIYVPSNPAFFVSEVRTPTVAPAPAGYVCSTEMFLAPDPVFPGGMIPVNETRCYWTYP